MDQVNIQDNSQENLADKSDTELVPPVEDNTKPSEEAALPAEPSDSEKEQQNEPTLTPEEEQKTEDAGQNGESDLVAPEDLSLPEAIPVSYTHLDVYKRQVEEARAAEKAGADYLGAGAVFPTGTKSDTTRLETETLKEICAAVSIPVAAIGGISGENLKRLEGTGIAGIAVVSAILAQEDARQAAMLLREKVRQL